MLWKALLTLAFMAAMVPHQPDVGLGKAPTIVPVEIEHAQIVLLEALERVRVDLRENRSVRP